MASTIIHKLREQKCFGNLLPKHFLENSYIEVIILKITELAILKLVTGY
jgi:hypothetical protein